MALLNLKTSARELNYIAENIRSNLIVLIFNEEKLKWEVSGSNYDILHHSRDF